MSLEQRQAFADYLNSLPGVPDLYDTGEIDRWAKGLEFSGPLDEMFKLYQLNRLDLIETELEVKVRNEFPNVDTSGFSHLPNNAPLKLFDSLLKQTATPNHRSIKQGQNIIVEVPGSESGYLEASIYGPDGLFIARWDGMPGNYPEGEPDPHDGKVIIPTAHPMGKNESIPFPLGAYVLKVEAASRLTDPVPAFWNIEFDVVAP